MKQLIFILGLITIGINVLSQDLFFFKDGTDQTFYDQGIVDLNSLGNSTFEHTAPPCCPEYNDKMPCSSFAYSGTSALKFNYTSNVGGNWIVSIFKNNWGELNLTTYTDLAFYIYSEDGLSQGALPAIGLKAKRNDNDAEDNSVTYLLGDYNNDIPAGQWTLVTFPLSTILNDAANSHLNFTKVKAVVFKQTEDNGVARTLYIDDISARIFLSQVDPVQDLSAQGYDSHVELNWTKPAEGLSFRIEASFDGGTSYELRGVTSDDSYLDFVREKGNNLTVQYRVISVSGSTTSEAVEVQAGTRDFTDEELMDMVQKYTWRYFWDEAHPTYGLTRERSNDDNPNRITSGGTGFGLMAMIIGYERNYAPQSEIKARILSMLQFLHICPTYHGAFSHWYNGATGQTIPFSDKDDGGDIVETSFVAAGLIAVKNYFSGDDAESVQIRQLADIIWKNIEWSWYRRNNQNVLYWHWSPNYGWDMNFAIGGFNETLVTYIMAASSPTHGVPAEVYHEGWARSGAIKNPREFYGYNLNLAPDYGGPMFWIHYTHLGLDPHKMKDQYTDYWTESVHVAKIQHAYAVDNPLSHSNYSDKCWGITASDQADGYSERRPMDNDNGTIAPTAALGSFPYTPEESMKALKYFYRERGADLFGPMGFYDAFNDGLNWVAESYLAIDQGPILIMMENYRSGLIWNAVMKDSDVKAGLDKLGYELDTSIGSGLKVRHDIKVIKKQELEEVTFLFPEEVRETVTVNMYTTKGELVKQEVVENNGMDSLNVNVSSLSNGIYVFSIITSDSIYGGKFLNN
ncbi:DUF3131 domain-containing protein [Labilibacter sediminis]|nr:DUF3131 domain-containing protein [Labilibacter sediminis]